MGTDPACRGISVSSRSLSHPGTPSSHFYFTSYHTKCTSGLMMLMIAEAESGLGQIDIRQPVPRGESGSMLSDRPG